MVSPGEGPLVMRSTVCDESAHVEGAPAEKPGSCARVASSFALCEPDSSVLSCDIASKTSRHFGHDRVCALIDEPSLWPVGSAIKTASCSRLGQSVMAIPRFVDSLTAKRKTARAVT
jgi:hypothetical protein